MDTKTNPHLFNQGISRDQNYPKGELMTGGHMACPGCGATIAMRLALKAMGPKTMVVIPACCWAVIPGPFPYTNLHLPLMHTAFETTGAVISGIKAALEINGDTETNIMGWAGDGGTFDIGLQSLSAAAERNEDVLYVCYDNEAYMNTGIQRSSATPEYAWTTTTPASHTKRGYKKPIDFIMANHRIPYVATTTPAFPHDMLEKFKKAKDIKGFRFIHILSSCIPGWRIASDDSVKVMKMAVDSNVFPIFEIFDGKKVVINIEPKNIPVIDYLKAQGRFRQMTDEQIKEIQKETDEKWKELKEMEMRD